MANSRHAANQNASKGDEMTSLVDEFMASIGKPFESTELFRNSSPMSPRANHAPEPSSQDEAGRPKRMSWSLLIYLVGVVGLILVGVVGLLIAVLALLFS